MTKSSKPEHPEWSEECASKAARDYAAYLADKEKREEKRRARSKEARQKARLLVPQHPALQRHADRLDSVRAALEELDADQLIEVLLEEFNQRRIDEHDNATEPPGLYNAAVNSMIALLGGSLSPTDAALAENLAAVGRGVRIRSKDKDAAPQIREINELVEGVLKSKNLEPSSKARVLALTLAGRFGRPVDPDAIAVAIQHDYPRRITEVAIEAGIYGPVDRDESGYYRDHHRHVKGSLDLIDPAKKSKRT